MRKKIFKANKIGGATVIISIASLLSYAIGLFRDSILARKFDVSNLTDAYWAAFLIPDIIFNLFIAGALSAAFLPVFSDYLTKDKKEAQKIANTMLTSATILIGILAIIAFIFTDQIFEFLSSLSSNIKGGSGESFDPIMLSNIINMTRILLASAILFAISNTLGNILMSYKHFVAYAISPILYNLGIILGIIFLHDQLGIYSAAVGTIIGAIMHCLIRVIDVSTTGFKYKPQLELRSKGFKQIIKLMIPKSISLIAWQINLLIYAIVGISMIEGSWAAFNFARNIQSFAVSLFGIAFATAVFPHLTQSIAENKKEKYTTHIQKTAQRILFFTIPAMIGLMLMSKIIIEIIFKGGNFNEESVKLTSIILFFFAISIPFESLVHILARGFYAIKNTVTPMLISVTGMTIIALTTIFIAPKYGPQWFSIGFTIGLSTQVVLLSFFLRKHLKNFELLIFIKSISKTIIPSAIMGATVFFLLKTTKTITETLSSISINEKISFLLINIIIITIGVFIFFTSSLLLKSEETSSFKYVLAKIFKKSR